MLTQNKFNKIATNMKNLKVQWSLVCPAVSSILSWGNLSLSDLMWLVIFIGSLCASTVALAQVPTNQLHFAFTGAPGTTTALSDTSLNPGAISAILTMFNPAGTTAVDLHGAVGSGVTNNAVTDLTRAMDFTSDLTPSQTNQPAASNAGDTANGNAVVAVDLGDTTLGSNLGNGGTINNFVITMWFKQPAIMPNGANIGGRLWILNAGTAGVDSGGSANSLGLKFQGNNQLYFQFGADTVTVGPALASPFPTNKWLFIAITYDGTNASMYYGSDTAAAQLLGTAASPGRSINLGGIACLAIGNRHSATANARGFNGWINDFRFYSGGVGTAAFVEGIRESALGGSPNISGVYPNGTTLMQGTNKLVFNASSSTANINTVNLVVNGIDVSGSLVTSGPANNLSCSYTGLAQNQPVNTAVITATDANGLSTTASATFDTFAPTNFLIEAEEFDFNSGQFIDNPDYTDGNPADANSYYGLGSTEGVDTHKGGSAGSGTSDYRFDNGAGTVTQTGVATGEQSWPKFFGLVDGSGVPIVDHMIGDWSSGEWQNYTKTFPSGNYNVYARVSAGVSSVITLAQVTSGATTSIQTTTNLGTFSFTDTSFGLFKWVPLLSSQGTLATVNLAGQNTVRATTGGGGNLDFLMFVPANTNLPVINPVYPDGAYLFEPTNKFLFTVSSPITTISTNNIQLTWNGVNVSSNLVFSGGPSAWNVTYGPLQTNQDYTAVINAADALGNPAQATVNIDTWNPVFQVEAEDFDFSSGQYIDNPVPTPPGVGAANSYEGQVGTPGIDEFGTSATGHADYRPADAIATTPVTDTARRQFTGGAVAYNVGFLGAGFWQNYTKTWPSGTFNVYGRMASGANIGTIYSSWSQVIAGWGTANEITRHIGSFAIPTTGGYSSYLFTPLIDKFGNYAQVTMGGTNTFRATELVNNQTDIASATAFGLNVNFYMLLAPRTDLPRIDNVYPDGSTLMQPTNTFSFVASSPTYGVNTNNIHVTLNGINITNLVFSGSASSWNVSYPGLLPNTGYTAVITMTDNVNQAHSAVTVTFDTFSQTNFTWEAEDFDFDPSFSVVPGTGARFIDNPVLADANSYAANAYFGQTGDSGIDYSPLFQSILGTYVYRSLDYVSTEVTSDAPRQKYQNAQLAVDDPGINDYDVNFFTNWIDYTHTYLTGNFNLYGRLSAGNGAFNMQCAQVTSGAGTSTQTTNVLGNFVGTGTSFATWHYVPLTSNGVPVVLSLGGVETLQMTGDNNENANFFMLVPVAALINTNAATANFTFTVTGGGGGSQTCNFSWAPDHLGWQLYTNSVGLTAAGSWFPVPGSAAVTNENIAILPSKTNVFFQLRYP
jgi:hypothetical protein